MKKDRYIYPAVFDYADNGISIEFPDLPGCLPCAFNDEEAIKNAKEALALHLYGMEQKGRELPEPSAVKNIKPEDNQVIMLVEVWMPIYRDAIENRAEKKTLTIPKWLNDALKETPDINVSQVLQEALIKKLGLAVDPPRHK